MVNDINPTDIITEKNLDSLIEVFNFFGLKYNYFVLNNDDMYPTNSEQVIILRLKVDTMSSDSLCIGEPEYCCDFVFDQNGIFIISEIHYG